jgi:hypothetical protein
MMAKPTVPGIPEKVFDLVPVQAHLPTELPPTPTAPPTDVTPAPQAIDAVAEHVVPLGVADLPSFFDVV